MDSLPKPVVTVGGETYTLTVGKTESFEIEQKDIEKMEVDEESGTVRIVITEECSERL